MRVKTKMKRGVRAGTREHIGMNHNQRVRRSRVKTGIRAGGIDIQGESTQQSLGREP